MPNGAGNSPEGRELPGVLSWKSLPPNVSFCKHSQKASQLSVWGVWVFNNYNKSHCKNLVNMRLYTLRRSPSSSVTARLLTRSAWAADSLGSKLSDSTDRRRWRSLTHTKRQDCFMSNCLQHLLFICWRNRYSVCSFKNLLQPSVKRTSLNSSSVYLLNDI